jgi:hypothetical protein
MAWGGSGETALAEVVYEPLPTMDREELRKLRATIGEPDDDSEVPSRRARATSSFEGAVIDLRDGAAPSVRFGELLEEIDRKLEKLLDGGPVSVINTGTTRALNGIHSEIDDLRNQLHHLQSSLDRLTDALIG